MDTALIAKLKLNCYMITKNRNVQHVLTKYASRNQMNIYNIIQIL